MDTKWEPTNKKKMGKPKVNGTKWEPEMIVDITQEQEYKVGIIHISFHTFVRCSTALHVGGLSCMKKCISNVYNFFNCTNYSKHLPPFEWLPAIQ